MNIGKILFSMQITILRNKNRLGAFLVYHENKWPRYGAKFRQKSKESTSKQPSKALLLRQQWPSWPCFPSCPRAVEVCVQAKPARGLWILQGTKRMPDRKTLLTAKPTSVKKRDRVARNHPYVKIYEIKTRLQAGARR